MPDLGQHSDQWCWVAALANSLYWWSQHGYPELLDDPAKPGLDSDYLDIDPASTNPADPNWFDDANGYRRLLSEIAKDAGRVFSQSVTNEDYEKMLDKFFKDQGVDKKLEWHKYEPPSFDDYKRELKRCEDVILVLDMTGGGPGMWHDVTGVSYDDVKMEIDFSDPWTHNPLHDDPGPGAPDHNNLLTHNASSYEIAKVVNAKPLTINYSGMVVPVVKMYAISPLRIHLDAEPPRLIDLEKPVSTQWHELYPNYSRWYHLSSWQDNCDGVLSRSDYIDLTDKETGEWAWYHVDEVTVTITLTLKPYLNYTMYLEFNGTQEEFLELGDPRSTWWHEVWPHFSTWWHILTWTDTDGSGTLTVSDQVDFEDGTEWHVDAVKTDIIVTKITIPGDINLDGIIDIFDIVIAAAAFGSQLGDPNWDERADLVLPLGLIDIFDLVKIASHYGQSAP